MILAWVMYGCSSIGQRQYLTLPDGSVFTRFEYKELEQNRSYTLFICGKYDADSLPDAYLKMRNSWRDGWNIMAEAKNGQIYLYEPYHNVIESVGLKSSCLKVITIKDTAFYKAYFDKSSKYLKLKG